MKRLLKYLFVVLIIVAMGSCAKEKTPKPKPEKPHSYTIMFYACCGGLDDSVDGMIDNVTMISEMSHNMNIKVVGQVKWSKYYRSEHSEGDGAVSRFKYNHNTNKMIFSKYAGPAFRVDEAENLAEFIEWGRQVAPADEYIIFFLGHGHGYHPSFDGITRGILRDDMYTNYLGIEALCQAFEMTDAKFTLTVMVSCLMNTLEYVNEFAPYTDYYYASNYSVLASDFELPMFVEGLVLNNQQENAAFKAGEYAIKRQYDIYEEWLTDECSFDASIARCSSIEALNSEIRNFVDIVMQLYDEQESIGKEAMQQKYGFTTVDIEAALGEAHHLLSSGMGKYSQEFESIEWYRRSYTCDIVSIVNKVAGATNHPDLNESAQRVEFAASEALEYQRLYRSDRVYFSVVLVNSSEWKELGFDEANYEALAFDKATGWSRLLKRNNATYNR